MKNSQKIPEEANNVAVGLCLCEMGSAYCNQYKTGDALAALGRSRSILQRQLGADHFAVAEVLAELSSAYREDGNYESALLAAEESLRIREAFFGRNHPTVADSLCGVGWVHLYQHHYFEAEHYFEDALTILETTLGKNHRSAAVCLDRLAESRAGRGDYRGALVLIERSLAIKEKALGRSHPLTANSFEMLGELQQATWSYEAARNSFGTCLQIRLETLGRDHPSTASAVEHLGSLFLDTRNYTNALACFEGALTVRKKLLGDGHPHVAVSLAHIADVWYRLGESVSDTGPRFRCMAKAAAYEQQAIDVLQKILGAEDSEVLTAKEYLAGMLLSMGELERAVVEADQALSGKRKLLARELGGADSASAIQAIQASFVSREIFESISAAASRGGVRVAETLAAQQLARNKALLEEIQVAQAALAVDPRDGTAQLRQELDTLLARKAHLSEREFDRSRRREELRVLEGKLARVECQLGERTALLGQAIGERNLTLTAIAQTIPSNAALADFLQYRQFDPTSGTNAWKEQRYAVHLTFPLREGSTNLVVERLDLGDAAPINAAVETVCRRMSAGQYAAKDLAPALKRLSDLVYGPVVQYLTNVPHLIVCPDGELSRLPFEMLSHAGRFLIQDRAITYVGSGREVARLSVSSRSGVQSSKPLVMGNPDFDLDLAAVRPYEISPGLSASSRLVQARMLSPGYRGFNFNPIAGAEAEARAVAALLGEGTVLRIGAEAREAELKAARSPRVLHLATHGFFLSDQEFTRANATAGAFLAGGGIARWWNLLGEGWENPLLRCGIALAGANHAGLVTNAPADDGLLTGLEASLLNLQGTELVILSACDSGVGDVRIGEGVMSLRRAFRIAGAQTVLASHWRVSDEATRLLVTEFMRRWRAGELRAEAWRQAQLFLLHSKDFSNPYFWASFTLTGQWR
jgi:CHAT domain-containing protein